MPNIHTPERGADETREDYAARRKASKAAVKAMTAAGVGSQRKAASSREQLRDAQRKNGRAPKGIYGASLMAHFARRFTEAGALRAQRHSLV